MSAPHLLAPGEPPAASLINDDPRSPVLLVCEHASRRLPAALANAYPADLMATHYGCDIGAGALLRQLARRLQCRAIAANYSRIVIDCNRRLSDPSLILREANGAPVPANASLTDAQLEQRIAAIYAPFHARVEREIQSIRHAGMMPIYIAIHSFTPRLGNAMRPWDAGIMWDIDRRIPGPLIEALAADGALTIGDNLPYSGQEVHDFSVDYHAERHGYANVAIEIRQDHLSSEAGVDAWAERLAAALQPIVADPALREPLQVSVDHELFERETASFTAAARSQEAPYVR